MKAAIRVHAVMFLPLILLPSNFCEILAHSHFEFWTLVQKPLLVLTQCLSLWRSTACLAADAHNTILISKYRPLSTTTHRASSFVHVVSLDPLLSVCSTLRINLDWLLSRVLKDTGNAMTQTPLGFAQHRQP
ncbi:hypothetical protein BDV96DRAFT_275090 [Lophiotrema nucula]|uniref:Secreted protein n=1 Tax=Lophiotrema nucula TaxID=690887 RepID=A0A6A5ZPF6_9PLEO|nr:hypothetical protein BDV96DRAFT_275090 [Lophiotrema nucula]